MVATATREKSTCGASGGPKGGFREQNTCWQLTGKHRERLAKVAAEREERERVAREEEEKKRSAEKARKDEANFRRSKIFRDISESIGSSDPTDVKNFHALMQDIHEVMAAEALEYNAAFDQLVDNFVRTDAARRKNRGAFISQLARAEDPTKVRGFDQVVQYVRDNPEVSQVLAREFGGDEDDIEAQVFQGLRRGKKDVPSLTSDEVWRSAFEFLDNDTGPRDRDKYALPGSEVLEFSLDATMDLDEAVISLD